MQPVSLLRALIREIGGYYGRQICRREFLTQKFSGFNERAVEYKFLFEHLAQVCPKTVLDVGTGKTALPQLIRTCGPLVTAIDNIKDYWPVGMTNRHYHVLDEDILEPTVQGPFDCVVCISTLEHIRDYNRAVGMMFSLLRSGGRIILTFPYCEDSYVENVYALPGSIGASQYQFSTQVFCRRDVARWQAENKAKVVSQEYWRFSTGRFWTMGNPLVPPLRVTAGDLHQISCLALEKQ